MSVAKTSFIGVRSGLLGGRKIICAPALRIAARVSRLLWRPGLSRMTIIAGGKRRGHNLHDRSYERLAVDRTIEDAKHVDVLCMQKFCERPGVGRGPVTDPDVCPVKGQRLSDKRGI